MTKGEMMHTRSTHGSVREILVLVVMTALVGLIVMGLVGCGPGGGGSASDEAVNSTEGTTTGQDSTGDTQVSDNGSYVPNQVIIAFKTDVTDEEVSRTLSCMGATIVSEISAPTDSEGGIYLVELDGHYTVEDAVSDLNQNSLVDYAQPNYQYQIS